MYAPAVVSSKALRDWLAAQIEGKRQTDLAREWGVEQPTISRLFKQAKYDLPLDTVGKIASAFGYVELSEFFRHVESGAKPAVPLPLGQSHPVEATGAEGEKVRTLRWVAEAVYAAAADAAKAPKANRPIGRARPRKSKAR